MLPSPRARRRFRVFSSALAALLAILWLCSSHWEYQRSVSDLNWTMVAVRHGCLKFISAERVHTDRLLSFPDPYPQGLTISFRTKFDLWFRFDRAVVIPLWVPIALLLLPSLVHEFAVYRVRSRARKGLCPRCGYDRCGINTSTPCPEWSFTRDGGPINPLAVA